MRFMIVTAIAGLAMGVAHAQVDAPMRGQGGSLLGIPPVEQGGEGATGPREPPSTGSAPAAPLAKRVKPPGSPIGEADKSDKRAAALERRQRELDRRVRSGICRGC